jgi:hydroxymethylpyrimidine/phosphomethylpyrimidine kinase
MLKGRHCAQLFHIAATKMRTQAHITEYTFSIFSFDGFLHMPTAPAPPRTLTIAGSDSGGGAGIQADLKTFAALGCHGMSAITAITAQNTRGIRRIDAVAPEMVAAQIDAIAEDIGIDAAKTGMLGDEKTVEAVAQAVDRHGMAQLVVDPVLRATSGEGLGNAQALARWLLPRARLLTPNLPEASQLLGRPVNTAADMLPAAQDLLALGVDAVLLKGGHLDDALLCDLLVTRDGAVRHFEHARIATGNLHGTGCTLAAAIVAHLARGQSLEDAVAGGIDYVVRAIEAGATWRLGQGNGPLPPVPPA